MKMGLILNLEPEMVKWIEGKAREEGSNGQVIVHRLIDREMKAEKEILHFAIEFIGIVHEYPTPSGNIQREMDDWDLAIIGSHWRAYGIITDSWNMNEFMQAYAPDKLKGLVPEKQYHIYIQGKMESWFWTDCEGHKVDEEEVEIHMCHVEEIPEEEADENRLD